VLYRATRRQPTLPSGAFLGEGVVAISSSYPTIYPPPFRLLVGERSCRPSPNHHSLSLTLLSTYTAEGIASLTAACPTHYKWHFGYYGGSVTIQAGYLSSRSF